MIGIAGMIGGAVFVLIGPAIGLAGGAVIIAFIVNAIIALFTAMAYAELGSAKPEAGGGYLWIREGLPRPNAFISGWMAWFAHIVAGSLYAVGFAAFVSILLKIIIGEQAFAGTFPFDKLIAIVSIAAFTYINVKGTSETGKTGTTVTIIQLGTIVALILAGFWIMYTNPNWSANFADFMPLGVAGILAAMGLTFIAFEGYEIIVQTGEEVKNPKKNIPRAIFISLGIVVTLYCLVALVSIGAIFPEGIASWKFIGENGELGILKAADLIIPFGAFLVLAGGIVSTLAALNATTFSSSRVALAMGRNYNLPHLLSSIHAKNKTPYIATIVSGVIMAVMAYALPLDQIAIAAGLIFLLLFAQVNVAVINIRRIYGDKLDYGFKTPLFPVISIIAVFLNLGLAIYLLVSQPLSWAITVLWVLVGFALYRIYTFKKEIEHYAPLVTVSGDIERKNYRILVPFTPENPDRLIRYAIRVARENDGEISILRVITVPDQTPLSAGIAFADAAGKAFDPLKTILDEAKVMNHYLVRISHDATEAILATIEEQRINLVITDFETLRNSKKLQALVTCDVLAIRTGGMEVSLEETEPKQEPAKKNMIVLYDASEHSDLALKAMSWLEHSGKYKVNVLSLISKEVGGKETEVLATIQQKEYLDQIAFEYTEVKVSEKSKNSSEKFANLLLSSINAYQPELVIAEATAGRFSFFSNPHFLRLLNQLGCPIIVAKHFTIPGIHQAKSWFRRAFRKHR
jgi:amino acid transporter